MNISVSTFVFSFFIHCCKKQISWTSTSLFMEFKGYSLPCQGLTRDRMLNPSLELLDYRVANQIYFSVCLTRNTGSA